MPSIWANFNHVFELFLGFFFNFVLPQKDALGTRLVNSAFSNMLYGKKQKPEMPEINRKLSKLKKHLVLTFYRY